MRALEKEILECKDKESIDAVFDSNRIYYYKARNKILKQIMGIKAIYTMGDSTDEDDYCDLISYFFEGDWKWMK